MQVEKETSSNLSIIHEKKEIHINSYMQLFFLLSFISMSYCFDVYVIIKEEHLSGLEKSFLFFFRHLKSHQRIWVTNPFTHVMQPDTMQMRSMWNEAKMLTLHCNILLNCCVLCILYGAASQTESVFKVARAMCASQLLFQERRACYVRISSVCSLAFSKSTGNSKTIYIYIPTHTCQP